MRTLHDRTFPMRKAITHLAVVLMSLCSLSAAYAGDGVRVGLPLGYSAADPSEQQLPRDIASTPVQLALEQIRIQADLPRRIAQMRLQQAAALEGTIGRARLLGNPALVQTHIAHNADVARRIAQMRLQQDAALRGAISRARLMGNPARVQAQIYQNANLGARINQMRLQQSYLLGAQTRAQIIGSPALIQNRLSIAVPVTTLPGNAVRFPQAPRP